MGMFDSVSVPCECGQRHEFQSKSGPCELLTFTLADAPADVLEDVNRHAPVWCECGNWLEVDIAARSVRVVPPPEPVGPLVVRLDDGKVLDFKRARSEGGGKFVNYFGAKGCGEFDRQAVGLE